MVTFSAMRLWWSPATANLTRVLAEGPTPPVVTADRTQRRADTRRRRFPLALLLVPVALVALGVVVILVLSGNVGDGILGGDDDAENVPAFDFKVSVTDVVATAQDPDIEALEAEADAIAPDVAPVLDELYTNAFLDPANWREGDYDEVFELFANGAVASAQDAVETLTLGATAGEVYDRVTPRRGSLTFTVLFDRAGVPDTVVARVRFYALGARSDGTFISIVSAGHVFLRDLDGWKITAFDVRRSDRETEPPTPAPSATATVSN